MPDHSRFIVWGPGGPYNPRCTHTDRDEARRAASQMARQHGMQRFYVCELVDVYEVLDVHHVDLEAERQIDDAERLVEALHPSDLGDDTDRPREAAPRPMGPAPVLDADGNHAPGCPCEGCIPF